MLTTTAPKSIIATDVNVFSKIVEENITENNLNNIVQFVALDWKNENDFQNLKSNCFVF